MNYSSSSNCKSEHIAEDAGSLAKVACNANVADNADVAGNANVADYANARNDRLMRDSQAEGNLKAFIANTANWHVAPSTKSVVAKDVIA